MAQWLARRYTGATLRKIGEAMGGCDYAAVGMAISRFEARLKRERRCAARKGQPDNRE